MDFVGLWSEYVYSYLLVITVITFFSFSVLIFLKPLFWAKMLKWKIPEETDLTVYFARCLGAFALMTNAIFIRVVISGSGAELMLEFFTGFCLFMVIVHIWGAIEGAQPMIETVEIGFWALLVILGLLFYPIELIPE
jgi:hypothetical protein